jgi:hypothetical protein
MRQPSYVAVATFCETIVRVKGFSLRRRRIPALSVFWMRHNSGREQDFAMWGKTAFLVPEMRKGSSHLFHFPWRELRTTTNPAWLPSSGGVSFCPTTTFDTMS